MFSFMVKNSLEIMLVLKTLEERIAHLESVQFFICGEISLWFLPLSYILNEKIVIFTSSVKHLQYFLFYRDHQKKWSHILKANTEAKNLYFKCSLKALFQCIMFFIYFDDDKKKLAHSESSNTLSVKISKISQ